MLPDGHRSGGWPEVPAPVVVGLGDQGGDTMRGISREVGLMGVRD